MAEQVPDFQSVQRELTAHIRNPADNPGPADVEDRRLAVYRELFYNNVENFMSGSFPVLRSLLTDDEWHELVRGYFANHIARTPLFPKLAQEFLHYLAGDGCSFNGPPFIEELAHYEWLELEVLLDKREILTVAVDSSANYLDGRPVLNPTARVHEYTFPVHRISPENQPAKAPDDPTYLMVYRDRDDEAGFMALNPMTARLIELIQKGPERSGRGLLEQIAVELQHPDSAVVVAGGRQILDELATRDVVIGAR